MSEIENLEKDLLEQELETEVSLARSEVVDIKKKLARLDQGLSMDPVKAWIELWLERVRDLRKSFAKFQGKEK